MKFGTDKATKEAAENIMNLYQVPPRAPLSCALIGWQMFIKCDATMVEVNPFAQTQDGGASCIDAKVNFDDNAAFRQKEIFAKRDFSQEVTRIGSHPSSRAQDANEVKASKFDLNYIQLDGNIGCLVNGGAGGWRR